MAKRSGAGNLAGLAGLAALGYMALKGRKGDAAPVEDRMGKLVEPTSDSSGEFSPTDYGTTGFIGMDTAGDASAAQIAQNLKPFASPKAAAPKAAAPKAAAPKPFAGTAMPMSQRDAVRQADLAMQSRPSTSDDVVTSRAARLAEEAKRPLAERQEEERQKFLKSSPLIAAPRAVGQFFEGADRRYLQSKLDRGETLTPMEKAQAKRAGMDGFRKGGAVKVKKMASGGVTRSSASKRADGIATKGKTRGKMY